jgi:uncharacterized protein YcbX
VRCVIPTRDPDTGVKDPRILRHLTREHGGLFGMNARYVGTDGDAAGHADGAPARMRVGDRISVG